MNLPNLMAFSSNILQLKLIQAASLGASAIWKGFSIMSAEPVKPRNLKRIGTHNGIFHCDEALACYILQLLPEYKDSEIVRTRDEEILKTCDVVLDVGAVYDADIKRFDHHQRNFNHTLSTLLPDIAKNKIKLSSAGLVYAHYGLPVINAILHPLGVDLEEESLRNVYLEVYESFIEEIDGVDNGIPMYDGRPAYRINTHLSARVHNLNPQWNSSESDQDTDKLFRRAMELAGGEFRDAVIRVATIWWPAKKLVKRAVKLREQDHISGTIVVMPEFCPMLTHLYTVEAEEDITGELKFLVFPDSSNGWRVRAIPVDPDSFVCRMFLHEDWRGLRNEALSTLANIPGCIFCHANGFIGGNITKEGAIEMAVKSLKHGLAKKT